MKKTLIFTVIFLLFIFNFTSLSVIKGTQQENWSEDIRLTFTENQSYPPAIAEWENNIHVVWGEAEVGETIPTQLWYIKSIDNGDTWLESICLLESPHIDISCPRIAVYGSSIHVIWVNTSDLKVHYIRSTDNGGSWGVERALTPRVYSLTDNWKIALFESNIHIIYMDYYSTLSYMRSVDNGITWSAPKVLAATTMRSTHTAIAVNDNYVHVVWEDVLPAASELFYIKSEDNGVTWGNITNITCTPTIPDRYVDMDIDNGNLYIVFGHEENARKLFFCYSEDNGLTWNKNIRFTNLSRHIFYPAIAVENNWIFVAWKQQYSGIFYKYSHDRGITWSKNALLTVNTSYNTSPDIESNNNTFHFVWVSGRDGNWEIYYKRYKIPSLIVNATVDIDPDTLNLKSKGRWITAYIELPEGYDVNDINISTILLEDVIPAENHPSGIGDHDNDGIPDLMVKFDRSDVEDLLTPSEDTTLKVTGSLATGESLEGTDTIRVI